MESAHAATEEDLKRVPKDGRKYELVDGAIVVSPAGGRHELVGVRLILELGPFVRARRLGEVFGSSMGFRLPSGNLRSPDVSFVSRARLPGGGVPVGFLDLAPDLAVEILSPDDRARGVLDKVGEYLASGTPLVWVIDPGHRRAAVYRSLTRVREVPEDGFLEGEEVVPGFRCRLAAVLE